MSELHPVAVAGGVLLVLSIAVVSAGLVRLRAGDRRERDRQRRQVRSLDEFRASRRSER